MGLYGAIIVCHPTPPSSAAAQLPDWQSAAESAHGESDFRLGRAAYDHPHTCYDRNTFQFSEWITQYHTQTLHRSRQKDRLRSMAVGCSLEVATAIHPVILINGRSMPDDMDPTMPSSTRTSPITAILTCIQAS